MSSSVSKQSTSQPTPQILKIYAAIYEPSMGNYYHWAFALNNPVAEQWHLFQVIQDEEGGPFRPEYLHIDPETIERCLLPLIPLGEMDQGWLQTLINGITQISVPGLAAEWNCQDYVMEIWGIARQHNMVSGDVYETSYRRLFGIYGQDFGGREEQVAEEEEDERRIKSEEFVYDSDE